MLELELGAYTNGEERNENPIFLELAIAEEEDYHDLLIQLLTERR
jgi:hypothetical protein